MLGAVCGTECKGKNECILGCKLFMEILNISMRKRVTWLPILNMPRAKTPKQTIWRFIASTHASNIRS